MRHKYLPFTKTTKCWDTRYRCQPTEYLRNKYYAYLKHRSQCRYRGESHELTWDDWHELWDESSWSQRGRGAHSLVLGRLDWDCGWTRDNVKIMSRRQHFEIKRGRKNDK